jgi:hypothetical protein
MEGSLTMSQHERERLKIIDRIKRQELTVVVAAESIGISERQMYRILKRYLIQGDAGLIHRLRGKSSNRGYPCATHTKVLRLYQERYSDYGATLFSEMLTDDHRLTIDSETLRRWLMAAGLWPGTRAKRPHRRKREPRSELGAMLQFDGSLHDWFEGRGPTCCLLVAIDDASNRVSLRFAESENTCEVLIMLRHYVERWGIPRQFYCDFGSVYYADTTLTDVGRALQNLGVEIIYAHSPQAKGRVERSNRTHQDRLIKALRRHKINSIDQANLFLDNVYLDQHNRRFAHTEGLTDVHRPADSLNLNNIFCFETKRQVHNDYTITLDARFVQLLQSHNPLPPPKANVVVRRWLDGSLHIFWNDLEVSFTIIQAKPKLKPSTPRPPAPDHPWRRATIGKARWKNLHNNKNTLGSIIKNTVSSP